MRDFANALRSGRALLMDGAMGTQLQRAGSRAERCYEAWNLTKPEEVRAIHESYVEAGAEVLLANTFQANSPALARHHQDENLAAIIAAGLTLARAALAGDGWVLADIGPSGATDPEAAWRVLDACREADGLLLETFSDPGEAAVFVRGSQTALGPKMPILVSFTFEGKTLRTFQGVSPEKCARAAADMGAAALGVNCGRELGMPACAEILGRYRATTALPLFARPNAGTPASGDRYPHLPKAMADQLPSILQAGAVMIGGCCGTTPEHIRAFWGVVDAWNSRPRHSGGI